MGTCKICGQKSKLIASFLGVCRKCILERFDQAESHVMEAHSKSRREFGLPEEIPRTEGGRRCTLCGNQCVMGEGERGYCGTKLNKEGKLVQLAGSPQVGFLDYYYDPLPTNCVASWVCTEGVNHPRSRALRLHRPHNLAVFYQSCTFNCLFCQNWHYRDSVRHPSRYSAQELANAVRADTRCICYFGGDPAAQMVHSLASSRLALKGVEGRELRICWETNGSMNRSLLQRAAALSLSSGGCIKFDLKCWDEQLGLALTGVSNRQTLENFAWLAEEVKKHPQSCGLVASTLLVPGYVTVEEVRTIARFIASVNREVPYSLLAFYPQFHFQDLLVTSREHADKARQAARDEGLQNVHVGNVHLLGHEVY